MKKRKFGKKLSRSKSTRKGLLRSQTRAFAQYGKIETTLVKAKFTQKFIEKLLRKLVADTVHTRRLVASELANDRQTTERLFAMAKTASNKGGFTRIVRLPTRRGDASAMARLELSYEMVSPEKDKKEKPKSTPKVKEKKSTQSKLRKVKTGSEDTKTKKR